MSAKKPAPIPRDIYIARSCGTISGINDHLGIVQQQCLDIVSRCDYALEIDGSLKVLTADEKKVLADIHDVADSGFIELSGFRKQIELIMRRSPTWHGTKY